MRLGIILLTLFFVTPTIANANKIKVVASFSILADMVKEVAGDKVEIKTLVGINGDPHAFEPTPADVKSISNADLIIVNGLNFEVWIPRLIEVSGYKGLLVVATNGITTLLSQDKNYPIDPHAWQSLPNGKIYIKNICDGLIKADPSNAKIYLANANAYKKKLDNLDRWARQKIAPIPAQKRKAITSHNAFQYLAQTYKIELIAPLGLNTVSDTNAGVMADLINQIRTKKVRLVFIENRFDPRLIKQLEYDGNAYLGGTLYADSLSSAGGPAANYLEMFKNNVAVLTEGMRHN